MTPVFVSFLFCIQASLSMYLGCQGIYPLQHAKVSSSFGMRLDPFLHTKKFHSGIDFIGEPGSKVRSSAKGQVIFSGTYAGYGNLVVVRHTDNLTTHYAHLWGARVHVGQIVQSGETLGFLGETGRVTGPHLHFEVRWNGIPINPLWILQHGIS